MRSSSEEIETVLLSLEHLAGESQKVLDEPLPEVPQDLKNRKKRWISCTVKNATQFDIEYQGEFFASGRFWRAPEDIPPFSQVTFFTCENDWSIDPTRGLDTRGGCAFQLRVDRRNDFDFATGWSNPLVGRIKAGVAASSCAEDGYHACGDRGQNIYSKLWAGIDEDGKPAQFNVYVSVVPGPETIFYVSQIMNV